MFDKKLHLYLNTNIKKLSNFNDSENNIILKNKTHEIHQYHLLLKIFLLIYQLSLF